jgi:hypothetical protein
MIKDFITRFKEFSSNLDFSDTFALGFEPVEDTDSLWTMFTRGFWEIVVIGKSSIELVGLRIMPGRPWQEWPVVRTSNFISLLGDNFKLSAIQTIAPSVASLFEFIKFHDVYSPHKSSSNTGLEDLERFKELALSFDDILHNKEGIQHLLDVINKQNSTGDEVDDEVREKLSADFWMHFDNSEGYQLLHAGILGIDEDKFAYKQKIDPSKDYGNSRTRLYHLMLKNITADDITNGTYDPQVVINCFEEPHFYDTEWMFSDTTHRLGNPTDTRIAMGDLVRAIADSGICDNMDDPIVDAIRAMAQDEQLTTYKGFEHAMAAPQFDEFRKEPRRAWNALSNATYWSGRNMGQSLPIPETLDAAIAMSRENGWGDALAALEYQAELYKELADSLGISYRFINEAGETVQEGSLSAGGNNISVADLPNGKYVLEIKNQGEITTQEYVKED